MISDVQLEDDAVFECQVGATATSSGLMSHKAQLTVQGKFHTQLSVLWSPYIATERTSSMHHVFLIIVCMLLFYMRQLITRHLATPLRAQEPVR